MGTNPVKLSAVSQCWRVAKSREMFQRNANEEEDVCTGEHGGNKQVQSVKRGYGKGKSGEWIMVLCVGRLFLRIAYR